MDRKIFLNLNSFKKVSNLRTSYKYIYIYIDIRCKLWIWSFLEYWPCAWEIWRWCSLLAECLVGTRSLFILFSWFHMRFGICILKGLMFQDCLWFTDVLLSSMATRRCRLLGNVNDFDHKPTTELSAAWQAWRSLRGEQIVGFIEYHISSCVRTKCGCEISRAVGRDFHKKDACRGQQQGLSISPALKIIKMWVYRSQIRFQSKT